MFALSFPIRATELAAQQPVDLRAIQLPRWTPEMVIKIGGAGEPDASFGMPFFMGVRTDGGVVIADASVPAIMVYSRGGKLQRLVGGRGRGPGEYEGINGGGLRGDSVWVWDQRNSRVTLFAPDGRVAYERVVTPFDNRERSRIVAIVGLEDERNLHVLYDPTGGEKAGGLFTRYIFLTDPSATRVIDTVVKTVVAERSVNADGRIAFNLPFTPINTGPIEFFRANTRVHIEQPPAPGSDQAELLIRSEAPRRAVREARFVYRPLAAPRDSLRAILGRLNARARDAARRALDMPEYLPAISMGRIDEAGRVWLRREDFQPGQPEWLVLDSLLRPLATVRFPPGDGLRAFSGGFVWVLERDALDDPSIVAYRFPALAGQRAP